MNSTTIAPPPLWEHLFLENPGPLVLVLVVLALLLVLIDRRRHDRKFLLAGGAAVLWAVALVLLAWFVTTTREVLIDHTEKLVRWTAPLDTAQLETLLDPAVTLEGPDAHVWLRGNEIIGRLEAITKIYPIKKQKVRSLGAEIHGADHGVTLLELSTALFGTTAGQYPTTWLLYWSRGADGRWRVTAIRWLRLFNEEPGAEMLHP